MSLANEWGLEGHPAHIAYGHAAQAVRELPSDPTPGQLLDWCTAVRESVATLCERVPSGTATQGALDLCVLVARGPRASPREKPGGARHAGHLTFPTDSEQAAKYQGDLQTGLVVLRDGMEGDVFKAIRDVLELLGDWDNERIASLLDVDLQSVQKMQDGRGAWVDPARILVVLRILKALQEAVGPSQTLGPEWFWQTSAALSDRRPIDLLDRSPWRDREVLASAARSSSGALTTS